MIWINFLRDLRHTASRLISVSIITMIAVVVYTCLSGILYNTDRIVNHLFQSQNTAEYWISGMGFDQGDCRELEAIPGVTGVEPRIQLEGEDDDGESTLTLCTVGDDSAINRPWIAQGSMPSSPREVALSDVYAQAHGLSVGDWYTITVTGTDVQLTLLVSGLVKSAEFLYHVSATIPAPDLSLYGYAYLNEQALEPVMGRYNYNQICLTTDGAVDEDTLSRAIQDALGSKAVNVLARADNPQAYTLMETKENIEPILAVFPVLFFLCAVLMMVSTMNRLVEHARGDIGTFKALGYGENTILLYYLLHALLVVVVGFPPGAFLGKYVAGIIVSAMATGCDLPPYTVVHDFSSWGWALLITAVCCLGSAFLVCRSLLQETPAQCMRPKAPKGARAVLLERAPAIWRRLSFRQKYIIRNTLRNKVRMLTCVFGIAFCMALVFLSYGIKDSMDHYTQALVSHQNNYDLMVDLSDQVTQAQYTRITRQPGVTAAELEMTTACWIYSPRKMTTSTLTVAEDTVSLKRYDPYGPDQQALPRDGILLEESLAAQLDVEVGDVLTLRFAGDNTYYPVAVAAVEKGVSGAYLSRSSWRDLGLPYTPTGAWLTVDDLGKVTAALENYDFVDGWQTRETATAAVVDRMNSTSTVVYILIVFGGGLACIVIYNLGIMSFYEQVRSLATLMVLGFYPKEIKGLQLSENLIFALVGTVLGIPLGVYLNRMILNAITTMPLVEATKPLSLGLSCAITMGFALAVNWLIGRKMREIDMLGALKSVE